MHLIHQFTASQVEQLHQLYQGEWWSRGRTLEETRQCVNSSSLCFGFVDYSGDLQAFARTLTDYIFKALIFDVIVAPGCRSTGRGDMLIQSIREHPALQKVKHFELYCVDAMVPFYQRLGFSTDVGGMQLMRFAR
ncbi:MAG: GNAT family N-acetyltransferase [Anaerolineaceae bacterium]|nr:GNAT family N-acetyltransferase [Anaerolineaceae bacterium]